MDLDIILEEVGEFGKSQKLTYFLICLPVLFAAANSFSYVFSAGIPQYRCFVPLCDNPDNPYYNEEWVPAAIPGAVQTKSKSGYYQPDHCLIFKSNVSSQVNVTHQECPINNFLTETERCNRWVYDKSERTIVSDWDITCIENEWKLALIGTLHFAGIIVGSGTFGVLADRYGRKLIFVFCTIFMSVTGIGQALSQDFITFAIFAFLNAVGTSGIYPLAFILGVELVGIRKRELSGIILNYFYAIGEACVGLVAWLTRDWVLLQYIVSAPPLLFISYYWIIPESVRWLLASNRTKKAAKIIENVAAVNGTMLSANTKQCFELQVEKHEMEQLSPSKTVRSNNTMLPTFIRAAKSSVLIKRTLVLIYIWIANAFVFYGLSLHSTNLSGNKYLNFILVCLVEIPGYTLAWITMNQFGRRWSLAGSFIVCGTTCIIGATMAQDTAWLLILLFLVGKMGVTASFAIIYVFSAEMIPTIIRSAGVGAMSTIARFGALLAPFVPLLDHVFESLPLILFGIVALIAGALSFYLPETIGKKLPDTIEEAEMINKS